MTARGRISPTTVLIVIVSAVFLGLKTGAAAVAPLAADDSPNSRTTSEASVLNGEGAHLQRAADLGYAPVTGLPFVTGGRFLEFRDVPKPNPGKTKISTDAWSDKLLAIGAIPSFGKAIDELGGVMRSYGGEAQKLSVGLTGAGGPGQASTTSFLVPRCETWACGDLVRALPGVALPIALAVLAFCVLSRFRSKRTMVNRNRSKARPGDTALTVGAR